MLNTLPYVVVSFVVSFLAIVGAIRFTSVHHETRNKVPVVIIVGSVIWLLMSALEVTSASLPTKLLFFKLQFIGVVMVPTTWLINAMQFAGYERWVKRSHVLALSAVPILTLLMILTNELYGLMWTNVTLNPVNAFYPLSIDRGLGYWLLLVGYSYVVVTLVLAIFVKRVIASRSLIRRQILPMIFVSCVPWSLSVAWFLNPAPFSYIDPTALGLTIAASIVFWRLAYLPWADVAPVAYEMIFDSMNDAVIILDAQTRIVELNPSAQQLVGHKLSDAMGLPAGKIWVDWTKVKEQLDSETERPGEVSLECGGKNRLYEMRSSYLGGIMSERPNLLMIFRDITEGREMEKNLREYSEHLEDLVKARASDLAASESKYRLLIDNMADAVFSLDLQGNVTFVSPQAEDMTGYSLEQMQSMNLKDVIAPEDLGAVMTRLEERRKGRTGLLPMQFNLLRADGTRIPIEIHTRLLADDTGNPAGVQGVARDVTERKRMEDALRESEARFRDMANMLPEIVFETDLIGNYTFANRSGLVAGGYTEEDLHNGLNAFQTFAGPDRGKALESFESILAGKDVGPREYTAVRKDGSRFPVLVHSTPIVREGKIVGARGMAMDITERKRMEEELLRARHLAAVGEAAAMVGHDLRNPLQATTTTLYLAKKLLASGKAEERSEALGLLNDLDNQVYYMDKVVSDLQQYANPGKPALTETNLNDLIAAAISNVKIPPNVQVSAGTQGDVSKVMANAALLRRVLVNLIMNAVQAMPGGGKLTVTACTNQEWAIIAVEDTGVGIPAENFAKIFSPFFTTKAQGQGLGLAVCKRLIEAQGGKIEVTSQVGKGSIFTINLGHSNSRAANSAN